MTSKLSVSKHDGGVGFGLFNYGLLGHRRQKMDQNGNDSTDFVSDLGK